MLAYLYGGAHGTPLSQLEPAYDCSSAVSYVLHAGGVFGEYAEGSTELESYGQPGPGSYVSIYANAAHAFVYIGGLRFDTVYERRPMTPDPTPKSPARSGASQRRSPAGRPGPSATPLVYERRALEGLIAACLLRRSRARGMHQS